MSTTTAGLGKRTRPKGRPSVVELLEMEPGDGTLHARLYRQLRERVLAGVLRAGARLPSARTLAADLGVSRNTVEAAYGQLQAEGFVERRVGAGTVVAESIGNTLALRSKGPTSAPVARRASTLARPAFASLGELELEGDQLGGPCVVDVRHFPLGVWTRLMGRAMRRDSTAWLYAGDSQGHPALRRSIADHVALTRGVRCDPSQIVVVHSTQQALDLITRLLLPPGGTAIVEDPGYLGAKRLFAAAGARVVPLPVDEQGLRVQSLPPDGDRSLVYVTPSHQYPLGVTLSLSRRLELLRWAATTGAWILEDDYDSEFRHDGRPIAALQGLDRAGRVIYLGTWNKILFPGLRLAYLVLPTPEVGAFVAARRLMDGPPPQLQQSVLAQFIADGHLAAYLRSARQHYTRRRDVLIEAAQGAWGPAVRFGPASTGLHLVAHLPPSTDDLALVTHLPSTLRVGLGALSAYYDMAPAAKGLLLSYGTASPLLLRRAVDTFAAPLREALSAGTVSPGRRVRHIRT